MHNQGSSKIMLKLNHAVSFCQLFCHLVICINREEHRLITCFSLVVVLTAVDQLT